jgi:hypothetical protein
MSGADKLLPNFELQRKGFELKICRICYRFGFGAVKNYSI